MAGTYKDITGQRFGRLVAIEHIGTKLESALWKCRCDCGNETEVVSNSLIQGKTRSCGCLRSDVLKGRMTIHGMTHTRTYGIWQDMKNRCTNPNGKQYQDYGGRGVSVCDEWKKFINFYNWAMDNGYKESLTIDRKDNMKGYYPGNCQWSTMKEQGNNRRNNNWHDYRGERKTISQWSEYSGIPRYILSWRLKVGWTIEETLETPIRIHKIYEKRKV